MKTVHLSLALAFAFLAAAHAPAAPALLGHPGLKGQTLDPDAAKAVLLGKRVSLGDNRVVIIIAKSGAAQEKLLNQTVAMTPSQFQNHWRRLFMTGGGSAPKIVETEADALKLSAETPGSIVLGDDTNLGSLVVLGTP